MAAEHDHILERGRHGSLIWMPPAAPDLGFTHEIEATALHRRRATCQPCPCRPMRGTGQCRDGLWRDGGSPAHHPGYRLDSRRLLKETRIKTVQRERN